VETVEGLEIARVTLIDATKQVLLDELVLPKNKIVDYLTQWSGVTAASLESVTTRLSQVQVALLRLIPADALLVGHSLENDLRHLKICHHRCIDTTVLYPSRRPGRKNALRVLAKQFLNRSIQDSTAGHDSLQDAKASLDLAQKKVQRGPDYGMRGVKRNLLDTLGRKGVECVLVGVHEDCTTHSSVTTSLVVKNTPAQIVASAGAQMKQVCEGGKGGSRRFVIISLALDMEAGVAEARDVLSKLKASAPPGVLLTLALQGGNLDECSRLLQQKKACCDVRAVSNWTDDLQEALQAELSKAMQGCVLVTVNDSEV
ncbi:unnamed protein product, partial [Chrysoparadoxa australica]